MHVATLHSLVDELQSIEKDAGVKDVLKAGTKALRAVPAKANSLALKGMARAHSLPGGPQAVRYVTDPTNTQDLAMGLGNLGRFFH